MRATCPGPQHFQLRRPPSGFRDIQGRETVHSNPTSVAVRLVTYFSNTRAIPRGFITGAEASIFVADGMVLEAR